VSDKIFKLLEPLFLDIGDWQKSYYLATGVGVLVISKLSEETKLGFYTVLFIFSVNFGGDLGEPDSLSVEERKVVFKGDLIPC
jgi:hypothetical protein